MTLRSKKVTQMTRRIIWTTKRALMMNIEPVSTLDDYVLEVCEFILVV
jgi:hypothetical protein